MKILIDDNTNENTTEWYCVLCGKKKEQYEAMLCESCFEKEELKLETKRLKKKINKALEILKNINFYTTPIGQIIHLDEKIKQINKVINILGSDKE